MELAAGQLVGNSHTFLVLSKNEGYGERLTGKGKNDFRLVFSADFRLSLFYLGFSFSICSSVLIKLFVNFTFF